MPPNGFADWRLEVGGLVEQPLELSLAELARDAVAHADHAARLRRGLELHRQMDGRAARPLLDRARLKPEARYIVFHCADDLARPATDDGNITRASTSIDAFHPQTILAYEMNGAALPIAHGAPLRLRVERQLGYKMAKYVMRIEAVDELRQDPRRPRRLLGGSRLRVVRRHLIPHVRRIKMKGTRDQRVPSLT